MKRRHTIGGLVLVLIALIFTTSEAALAATTGYQNYYSQHPDQVDDFLGAAQHFNVFARIANMNTDTEGNIAAETFMGTDQGFDTWRGRDKIDLLNNDDNYIQLIDTSNGKNIPANVGNDKTTHLVLGAAIPFDGTNSRPNINGRDVDGVPSDRVFSESSDDPYIDFDAEFAKLEAANQEMVQAAATPDLPEFTDASFPDLNNRVIDVSGIDQKAIVLKIKAEVLEKDQPLTIEGLEGGGESGKQVFIVVDTEGSETFAEKSQVKLGFVSKDSDGNIIKDATGAPVETERSQTEVMDFTDSTILWTFTNGGQPVTDITIASPWMGTILAPDATLSGSANIQGSVIVNDFEGSGSLYRWDWQGRYSPSKINGGLKITAEKYDQDSGSKLVDDDTLAPMTFTLEKDGDPANTVTLDSSQNWSTKLTAGTYVIKEATPPVAYQNDADEELTFTVDASGTITDENGAAITTVPSSDKKDCLYLAGKNLVFRKYDRKKAAVQKSLKIYKYNKATKSELTGDNLTGIQFEITKDDEAFATVTAEKLQENELTLTPGSYTIKETAAPKGYDLESGPAYSFTIDETGAVSKAGSWEAATSNGQAVTTSDGLYQDAEGNLYFQKFDTKTVVAPTLHVLKYDQKTQQQVTDSSGIEFTLTLPTGKKKTLTPDSSGNIAVTALADGSYSITETKAPVNYLLDKQPFTFTIKAGQVIQSSSKTIVWDAADKPKTDTLAQDSDGDLYFQKLDPPIVKKLKIFKYDYDSKAELTGTDLGAISFDLLKDGKVIATLGASELKENDLSLTPGHYELKETQAPSAYYQAPTDADSYDFTISAVDGSVENVSEKDWSKAQTTKAGIATASTNTDGLYLDQSGDTLYFQKFDERKELAFSFYKYDADTKKIVTKTDGLEFTLYTYTDKSYGDSTNKRYRAADTAHLKDGYYGIKETSAPAGYQAEETVYYFAVKNGKVLPKNGRTIKPWLSSYLKKADTDTDSLYQLDELHYAFQKFDKVEEHPLLPHTGGKGIYLSSLIGVLAILLASGYFFTRSRQLLDKQ